MKWGYCRVSTIDQDLSVQEEWLKSKGIDEKHIFEEKISGKSKKNRQQLENLMDLIQSGDTIYVFKLDRLSRSAKDSLDIITDLRRKGVNLELGDIGRIEDNQVGNLIFTIFSAIAEMERSRIVERTQEGKAYQREHNPNFKEGRPQKLSEYQIKTLIERTNYESISQLAKSYNVSRNTIYRYIEKYKDEDLKMR